MKRRASVLIFAAFCCFLFAGAQNIEVFVSYQKAYDVVSDAFSIYCGTDNGILVFDGAERAFRFHGDPETLLEGHHVYALIAGADLPDIFAFTDRGVYRRRGDKTWEKIRESLGPVTHGGYDQQLFSVRSRNGSWTYDWSRFEWTSGEAVPVTVFRKGAPHFTPADPQTGRLLDITDYEVLQNGEGVFITAEGYLMRFSSSSSYALRNNGALYGRHVSDIIFAGEDQIWFVGDHLNLYQKGVFTFVRDAELKDNVNDALWIDSQLWLATKNNGVARYVNGRLQPVIKVDAGLLDNNIISLKSRGRRLYLLSKYGINSFLVNDPRKVKEIRGIDFFNVTRFDVSENNIILLHRDRLVITDLNGKSLYTYSASTLWNDFLNEMQRDGDILYICGNAGIITYDLQTRDFSVIRAMREGVSDLLVKNSLLYAATETGLYIIDIKKEQFRVLTEEDGLRSSRILKVYPFQTGVLVMTDKGLNYLP